MNVSRGSAAALVAALGLTATAHAQMAPPPPPPQDGAGHHWDPASARRHMVARRAEHLKALHDVLQIRPDQEGAFQTFAAAMDPPAQDGPGGWDKPGGRRAMDQGGRAPMTTPERLDAALKRFDDHTARMRAEMARRAAALKGLYAALSPEQRRTLDALPELEGHGDHDEGGGWGGHGGGPGPGGHGGPGQGD